MNSKDKILNKTLFPPIEPYTTGHLKVDDTHDIYWELSGNPKGIPVIVLHGGPGGGSSKTTRRFFDPKHYKILQFDQRGCGQSKPFGSLINNTTDHLINDINLIVEHLDISRFHLFGGSWGSTLALAYAQAHPEKCLTLTLRGIFMMRQQEIDWFMEDMGAFFPEAFDRFQSIFPGVPKSQLLHHFYTALTGDNEALKHRAAVAWSALEATSCFLIPEQSVIDHCEDPKASYAIALLEAHYFVHNKFIPDDKLLKNINKIRHIPCTIVQGRYDIVCPPRTAWDLKKAWPEAQLEMIPDAGHASIELGVAAALVKATEEYKKHKP